MHWEGAFGETVVAYGSLSTCSQHTDTFEGGESETVAGLHSVVSLPAGWIRQATCFA